MLLLMMLKFSVTPLPIPKSFVVEAESRSQNGRYDFDLSASRMIRMNQNGVCAVLVTSGDKRETGSPKRILVYRSGRLVKTLSLPSDEVFSKQPFTAAGPVGPNGAKLFPKLVINSVLVSPDARVYVSMESPFDGAYSGVDRWSFFNEDGRWSPIPALEDVDDLNERNNITVTAVVDNHQIAYVEDYDRATDDVSSDAQSGLTNRDRIWIKNGTSLRYIGNGTVSAARNHNFAGYDLHYAPIPPLKQGPVDAFVWSNGQKTSLGRGIAWAVDSRGRTVGDDRSTADATGQPTTWFQGKKTHLSQAFGSAFAMNDRGQVVGELASGGAFLVELEGAHPAFAMLDRELHTSPGRWHIEHAYAITDFGVILAMARTRSGTEQLVMLTPKR